MVCEYTCHVVWQCVVLIVSGAAFKLSRNKSVRPRHRPSSREIIHNNIMFSQIWKGGKCTSYNSTVDFKRKFVPQNILIDVPFK